MIKVGGPYRHVQQQLPPGPVQDLHQVADALLPDVQRMLPGGAGHNVLSVSREAAALPGSSDHRRVSDEGLVTMLMSGRIPTSASNTWMMCVSVCLIMIMFLFLIASMRACLCLSVLLLY